MTPQEQFQRALDSSGITPAEPLYAVLRLLFDNADSVKEAVKKVGCGLTPQAEMDLIFRVTKAVEDNVKAIPKTMNRRFIINAVCVLGIVGILGFLVGSYVNYDPSFLASLAKSNDAKEIRTYCMEHIKKQGDVLSCQLPAVWLPRT